MACGPKHRRPTDAHCACVGGVSLDTSHCASDTTGCSVTAPIAGAEAPRHTDAATIRPTVPLAARRWTECKPDAMVPPLVGPGSPTPLSGAPAAAATDTGTPDGPVPGALWRETTRLVLRQGAQLPSADGTAGGQPARQCLPR